MTDINKLPLGIQSFEKIRCGSYYYIDKTKYIWNLIQKGSAYFLSRPRRFGKSLLISTFEAYFRGKADLFEGLYIKNMEDEKGDEAWEVYPVIKFSLSGGDYHAPDGLADMLNEVINSCCLEYDLFGSYAIRGETLPLRFKTLIEQLYTKTGKQIVILVDEYDKPLLETMITDEEQEEKNRRLYKAFFSILKDADQYLRFVFFTGVTRFSKVSIFSDLNQLRDISLSDEAAEICGITDKELDDKFQTELEAMASAQDMTVAECRNKLSQTYDGYHFSKSGKGVYNPFSLLSAFSDRDFGRYWFSTGTPTFLVERLRDSDFRPEQFVNGVDSTEAEMMDYRADNPNPIPLFYQSGYLTICGFDKEFRIYSLRFPNDEVRYGFLNSLVPYVFGEPDAERPYSIKAMVLALRKGDIELFMKQMYSLFASVPYMEGKAPDYENVWRNQIYLVLKLLGQNVISEPHTSRGRCDCIIETAAYIYIFEYKVDDSADGALFQIEEKGYADPYLADRRDIVKVGVNFSSEKRNIEAWKIKRTGKISR